MSVWVSEIVEIGGSHFEKKVGWKIKDFLYLDSQLKLTKWNNNTCRTGMKCVRIYENVTRKSTLKSFQITLSVFVFLLKSNQGFSV